MAIIKPNVINYPLIMTSISHCHVKWESSQVSVSRVDNHVQYGIPNTLLDLAQHSRLLLNNHPKYPRLVRWTVLYPLYALAEAAIISTDLAELLGSAIGLVLIFPRLPLPIAVLLTALDVFIILAIGDPSRGHGRPVRIFEYLIIVLVSPSRTDFHHTCVYLFSPYSLQVLIVFICFFILIVEVSPDWGDVFYGYVPSSTLVKPEPLYLGELI